MTAQELLGTDEQLTGEVVGALYADPLTGFGVVELDPRGELDGARCSGPLADLTEGQTVTLMGRWRDHAKYGPTFEAVYYEQVAPTTVAGLQSFLFSERFDDVPIQARTRALTTFGTGLARVIENEPGRLRAEAGLDQIDADALVRLWMSGLALAELVKLVESVGWPMDVVRAVHRRFGAHAAEIATEDPYRLLDADRVQFAHADALGRSLGIEPSDPRRLRAGARSVVAAARSREGHQHLEFDTVVAGTAQRCRIDRLLATEGVQGAIDADLLAKDAVDGVEVVSTPQAFTTERELAQGLARLAGSDHGRLTPFVDDVQPAPELTDGQAAAVSAAFAHPVSLLTGGPGTGKTRTVQEIVRGAFEADLEVALCAPTGRAAKRMEELVGRSATTIHRLLEARPATGGERDGGFFFRYGPEEQLPQDLIVIDEVSMCDTWLANRLISAIEEGTHVVLVGDPDQLPSVGPGDVLRDLMRSEQVPVTHLTEIHRQAADSRIVSLAREVLAGQVGSLAGVDGDVFLAEERRRDVIVPRVVQAVAERAPSYFGVAVDEIQVLAPMYRGPVGVDALNAALKEALNPPQARPSVAGFHVGDRVMQTRNDPELDVANGDVGTVVDLDRKDGTVRVAFARGEVTCDREQARRLTPAWAVTVHKSQGGEWPVVVLVLDTSHRSMLWRNLAYTAITRAQRALIIVGQANAVHTAAAYDRPSSRNTGLAWRLSQEMGVA